MSTLFRPVLGTHLMVRLSVILLIGVPCLAGCMVPFSTPIEEGCGNGQIDTGEGCDDGNETAGDGCDDSCLEESGWQCIGRPSTCYTSCGDGVTAGVETCDDGNNLSGDGCTASCDSDETCGNGIVDVAVDEACDDGNLIEFDGCDSDCTVSSNCNHDGTCDAGESQTNCPDDCPPDPCDHDGTCDGGESHINCPDDCPLGDCNPASYTGPVHGFVVSEIFLPDSYMDASENGVDLDGDGDVDNKFGQLLDLMGQWGYAVDVNQQLQQQITAGDVLLLVRMQESGLGDGAISLRTIQGGAVGSPPAFDGNDSLPMDSGSPNLVACSSWATPTLATAPADLYLVLPLMFDLVMPQDFGWFTFSHARVETVSHPSSSYYGTSAVTPTGWTDVMVGGGLTQAQIEADVIPTIHQMITDTIAGGGPVADDWIGLFDGSCNSDLPNPLCANAVPGQGECDDTANPAVITLTEVACNPLINSALEPDVDMDGDGTNDLFSIGFRIVSAVTATLY